MKNVIKLNTITILGPVENLGKIKEIKTPNNADMAENIDDHNSTLCNFFCKSNADVAGLTNKADINTTPTV